MNSLKTLIELFSVTKKVDVFIRQEYFVFDDKALYKRSITNTETEFFQHENTDNGLSHLHLFVYPFYLLLITFLRIKNDVKAEIFLGNLKNFVHCLFFKLIPNNSHLQLLLTLRFKIEKKLAQLLIFSKFFVL